MTVGSKVSAGLAALAALAAGVPDAHAQDTIKIGELNSYKSQPAFLEPYRRGWQMAIEDINNAGGVIGKKLEVVSRDDNGNPGDAVRVAEELVSRENVVMIAGTFLSNIGLAVTDFAGQRKVLFLAAEPLTDKITWQNGNRYTFRLRTSAFMQVSMMIPDALAAKRKRWAVTYPNFEYGQAPSGAFKTLMKLKQPDVEFVTDQATPLGRIDAGAVAQAIDDSKPDGIFNAQFGTDLAKFVREGNTRGTFKNRTVVSILTGEPEYLDPLKEDTPEGWIVTGYPWEEIQTPAHKAFVAAYQRERTLTAGEVRALPALLRAAALRFWISRLWDWQLPRNAALLQPKDPLHFERVLRARVEKPWHATA